MPDEVKRCTETFDGIPQNESWDSLLAALRVLSDPEVAKAWEGNFKSLERLWEAVAPDPCLYSFRYTYTWLCAVYIAHRRRNRSSKGTYGELNAKTRALIQENTRFIEIAQSLPVYRIDANTLTELAALPTAADKAAALEAALTQELSEGEGSFTYRRLGERLAELKQRKDTTDEAVAARLNELQQMTNELARTIEAPERLYLTGKGEFELFEVLQVFAPNAAETYIADCARRMVAYLRDNQLLTPDWHDLKGARIGVRSSLLVEAWNPFYHALGFDRGDANPAFLDPAIEALTKADE